METQGERIRLLRKHLHLSGEKFGARIGVKKNTVSQIETGKNSLTEQMFKSICREFNVSEHWLRTGEGDMFQRVSFADEYTKAAADICNNDPVAMQVLINYWKMDPGTRDIFWNGLVQIADIYKKAKELQEIESIQQGMPFRKKAAALTPEEINAEVEEYRRELELEARAAAGSGASGNGRKNA